MQILHRWDDTVIYDAPEALTVYQAVIKAIKSGADLSGANLSGTDLSGADLSGANLSAIPIVPNIDVAILAAIEAGGALDMATWHTCQTTHCRAGWAITLAGEDGAKLEANIGPAAAGTLIYAASRPGKRVPDFYANNEEALEDLRAGAQEQSQ